jgi:glucokinase
MKIVAGDVGGTKTLLRFVDLDDATHAFEQRYESGAFATFDLMLADLLAHVPGPIGAACFAMAGPVLGDRAEVTNLGWHIESGALSARFSIGRVALINDFYAVALGVPLLAPADLLSLNRGTRVEHAPIAILGAGTGLGEANLFHDGAKWIVIPGEGGHADFAPQDEEQAALLLALQKKYGHVSWERLLSGLGLVNIHNFLTGVDEPYLETIPMKIADAAKSGDAAAIHAFEIFVDIYGAEAGNMALRTLARGGVFLAGGIAGKNAGFFTDGRFVEAFLRKGRFRALLGDIPVDLIENPRVGLIGAAEMARRLMTPS